MSPTMTTSHPHRRLSSRRGSITAPDPFALHADINDAPDRTSSSKLTIVRVLPQQHGSSNAPITLNDPPTSFTSVSRRRSYRMGATSPPPDGAPTGRLSFAFSSFGAGDGSPTGHHRDGSTSSVGPGPSSPTSSPRMRPIGPNSSPRLSATGGSSYSHSKPRLTPEQLVDLARQASDPRTLAQIASTTSTSAGPSSPCPPGSPILRANSPALGAYSGVVAPATFTPLPDDIYLPFVDRPYEVSQLISTPPDAKLFHLLAQTLPRTYDGPLSFAPPDPDAVQLPPDPAKWMFTHLHAHLTKVDRDVEPDVVWVAKARKCILSHSELIWERVKGCFGVPPELDHVDWDWEKEERIKASLDAFQQGQLKRANSSDKQKERMRKLRAEIREGAPKPSIRGGKVGGGDSKDWDAESALDDESEEDEEEDEDEHEPKPASLGARSQRLEIPTSVTTASSGYLSPEKGKTAGGHWSDWDAIVDSPVHGRDFLPSRETERASSIEISGKSPSIEGSEGSDEDFIEIEALVASSDSASATSPPGTNPPPLSLGGSMLLGNPELAEGNPLGDIAEGEEDEEEAESKKQPDDEKGPSEGPQEDGLIPPAQIQGLRISTAPVHASGAYGAGGAYVPHHRHPFPSGKSDSGASDSAHTTSHPNRGSFSSGTGVPVAGSETVTGGSSLHLTRTHSRTSSFSSATGVTIGPFSRSESTGNLGVFMAAANNPHYSGSDAGDSSGYISDSITMNTGRNHDHTLGDRFPGEPLFVSNFARLNGLPTLHPSQSPPNRVVSPPPGHLHSRQRVKRTGSTSGPGHVGSVPSSSFIGSKGAGGLLFGGAELARTRTNSQGTLGGFEVVWFIQIFCPARC